MTWHSKGKHHSLLIFPVTRSEFSCAITRKLADQKSQSDKSSNIECSKRYFFRPSLAGDDHRWSNQDNYMNQSRLTAALSKMLLHGKLNSDRSLKGTIRLSLVLQKHNDYLICSKTETHQRKSNRSHRIVGALQRVGEAPLPAAAAITRKPTN